MTINRSLPLLFIILLPLIGWSQGIVVTGLPHSEKQKSGSKTHSAGRTKAVVNLPFWDDFSATETTFANPDLWLYGRSVRINDGMAILPPSLKVATFDGIDSVGNPYSVNDVLAKGYADKLVSQDIDLSTVPEAERNSVWLSYMYQMKGNGEAPDSGDRLLLLFFDNQGDWIPVDTIENTGALDPAVFYTSFVQVEEERYFHEAFKFRIQNFARLSGPYDTWHVDYIYLNKGRDVNDISFPDRTISEPLTNLFGVYSVMPVDHLVAAGPSIITKPSVIATNMRTPEPGNEGQVVAYTTFIKTAYWTKEDTTKMDEELFESGDVDDLLRFGQFRTLPVTTAPDVFSLTSLADSIRIDFKYGLNTRDNEPEFEEFPGDTVLGDYDPLIYAPIDFRSNDTSRVSYLLVNKYAYDDGTAEYGAGLNQPGAQIAYQYNLVGVPEEDINYLEMYFPRFGDESSQVLELRIWSDTTKDPIYTEVTTLQRSEDNVMWLKKLVNPVRVGKTFYIGWKQTAAAVIAVGLDKNRDTGNLMAYNINGRWKNNDVVRGSLMLRPVFGPSGTPPSGFEDELSELQIYPNPSSGTFYFNGVAETISVYDMTGRSIPVYSESTTKETKLILSNALQGIYIVKAHVDGRVKTAKVLIK